MSRHVYAFQILAIFWVVCTTLGGCATTQKIADDILTGKPALKKKVAVLPTTSSAWLADDLRELLPAIAANFLERNCEGGLFIVETPTLDAALSEIVSAPGANIESKALAQVGRAYGLSAILSLEINDMDLLKEKEGIWGFREVKSFLTIGLRLRMHDTETTAVILDHVQKGRIALPESMAEEVLDLSAVNDGLIRSLLSEITDEATERACDALMETPWRGYITVDGDGSFTISAGQDVGLQRGDTLEVFAMAEAIEGLNQRLYRIPGPKIGEVTIRDVFKHHSTALKVWGDNLEESGSVMLKP